LNREAYPEAARVTILASEENEVFQLGSEDEAIMLEAVAEVERGEVISASKVLEQIRKS